MPTDLHQRATYKGNSGKAKPQTHFAKCVGQIDIRFSGARLARAALGHAPALIAQGGCKLLAALWMARRKDQQKVLIAAPDASMCACQISAKRMRSALS